jgi:hypothetical protein
MCRRSAVAEVAESRILSCRPDLMALKILVLGVKRFISFQPLLQLYSAVGNIGDTRRHEE